MNQHTFEQNQITFTINLTPDQYGNLSVIAHPTGQPDTIAHGKIPGTAKRSHPRIEFSKFCRTRYNIYNFETGSPWLLNSANHRYHTLDDFDTSESVQNHPIDRVEFDIAAEIDTINTLRNQPDAAPVDTPAQSATPSNESSLDFDHTGLGISGLSRHTETPIIPSAQAITRYEKLQALATTCRHCHQTDMFDGAMFTTDPASGLCDDCY